jgi:GAF domain-containing protein
MVRKQDLLVAFIEFADTMVDAYDVVDFLDRLAERCVELTNATDVGIMLADRDGTLQYAASSSDRIRGVELFELQHEEGPGLDAFRGGIAVHGSTSDDAPSRWPRVTPKAEAVGFRSMSAFPMRLRNEVIGALNIFSADTAVLSGEDQMVAQALADVATIGILQARARNNAQTVTSQLETALESRIVIEQAKGVIAEHGGFGLDHAFAVLRGYARSHNRRLSQTAGDIVEGRLNIGHLAAPAATRSTRRA